jgi:predicted transposase YbfD/YdcC
LRKAIVEDTPPELWSAPVTTTDSGHGRIEVRSIRLTPLYSQELDFPGARTIAIVDRFIQNKKTGKSSSEQVAYISSLVDPSPAALLAIIRAHWTIENCFFHVRDTVFMEDLHTLRTKDGPLTMALLRNFAISFVHLIGTKSVANTAPKLRKAALFLLEKFNINFYLTKI